MEKIRIRRHDRQVVRGPPGKERGIGRHHDGEEPGSVPLADWRKNDKAHSLQAEPCQHHGIIDAAPIEAGFDIRQERMESQENGLPQVHASGRGGKIEVHGQAGDKLHEARGDQACGHDDRKEIGNLAAQQEQQERQKLECQRTDPELGDGEFVPVVVPGNAHHADTKAQIDDIDRQQRAEVQDLG